MIKKMQFAAAALTLGLAGSLVSCSQEKAEAPAPRATGSAEATSTGRTAAQLNWLNFTTQVEAGTLADPFGQYVSKTTLVASTGGARSSRPKREAADWSKLEAGIPVSGGSEMLFIQPDDPDSGGGGGGGYYPPPYSFVSSENVAPAYPGTNPGNYIYDLKLVTDQGYSYQFADYTRLNLDLNKGAGGRYIYFTFTRQPGSVQFASNYWPITRLSAITRTFDGAYSLSDHEPVYMGQWLTDHPQTGTLDLNAGAGGDYIYSFESHNSNLGAPIKEVGVIASRDSNIQPPAGWERVGVDLNQGAGGDYIFMCVKR